jgi:hypothetical protein
MFGLYELDILLWTDERGLRRGEMLKGEFEDFT